MCVGRKIRMPKSEPEGESPFDKSPENWTEEDSNKIVEYLLKWYEREKTMDRRKKKKNDDDSIS